MNIPASNQQLKPLLPGPPRIQITLEPAIRQLLADFGMESRDLAQVLGVDQRTITRWASGDAFPRHDAKARLEALADLDERLNELFISWDAARAWMRTPSRHLGDMAPMDAVRAGRIDRVVALIEAIDSGFAS